MTKILAFDISSKKTGVAVFNNGRLLKSSFELIEPNIKWLHGEKLTFFRNEIKRILNKHNPDNVVIEDIFRGRNLITFKTLAMFRGVAIQTIYEELGYNPASLMPSDARSTIGIPIKKEEAFKALAKKYKLNNFNYDDHNDIVDAIGLGLAMHTLMKQGIDAKSLYNSKRKKRRKRRGNKKGV